MSQELLTLIQSTKCILCSFMAHLITNDLYNLLWLFYEVVSTDLVINCAWVSNMLGVGSCIAVVDTSRIDEKGDLRGKESESQLEKLTQMCALMNDIVK